MLVLALAFFSKTTLAKSEKVETDEDTFINEAYPENNYGEAGSIVISNHPITRSGFIEFDRLEIPEEAIIDEVKIKVYVHEQHYNEKAELRIEPILSDWDEEDLDWNHAPDDSVGNDLVTSEEISLNTGWKSIEITEVFLLWKEERFDDGVYISVESSDDVAFSLKSKESGDKAPYLDVEYHMEEEGKEEAETAEEETFPVEDNAETETPASPLQTTIVPTTTDESETKKSATKKIETTEKRRVTDSVLVARDVVLVLLGFGLSLIIYSIIYIARERKEEEKEEK